MDRIQAAPRDQQNTAGTDMSSKHLDFNNSIKSTSPDNEKTEDILSLKKQELN